ncbi:hypothetical protein C1637_21895 [Chryseobacterium lactis]|uniref:Secreted protein n=1 Tax=Chryseobacterium lactis TaxID=1241981 RepID=A0A3G6RN45_CHRLC|nr:hypothetical protein [Chryseobacterium lactis]AZA84935.1 hypothetical protein EG342_24855 [Chryseobacterium lactis]AZB05323.1 hypothetical protein EG341_15735 [Chryseobacterium lactis]PNW11472.1 hypothetical protein C1637_21895 [Chryseobacterium lactis]
MPGNLCPVFIFWELFPAFRFIFFASLKPLKKKDAAAIGARKNVIASEAKQSQPYQLLKQLFHIARDSSLHFVSLGMTRIATITK